MIKEKTGKLINDRTQTFGLNFIDLMSLSATWLFLSLVILEDKPMLSVAITGLIYLGMVIIRTSKRPGWAVEILLFYIIREFFGGLYSERNIRRNK